MGKKNEELFELKPDEASGNDKGEEKKSTELAVQGSSELISQGSSELAAQGSSELTSQGLTEVTAQEAKKPDDSAKSDRMTGKGNNKKKKNPASGKKESSDNAPDDFAEEIETLEHEKEDEEIMKNLSESINRQVEIDLVNRSIIDEDGAKKNVEAAIETEGKPLKALWKKIPKWGKITGIVVISFILVAVILVCTGLGEKLLIKLGSKYVADKVNYSAVVTLTPDQMNPDVLETGDGQTDGKSDMNMDENELMPSPEPTAVLSPTPTIAPEIEEKIVNILLLGEENIDSYSSRGRTDSMIIASINTIDNTLKFTSIMRDSLVDIPGYSKNRINAAYAIGGVAKLYEVLEANFGITPDNYALVRFSDFERIVDSIGGVDISLSSKEASYLNRTNYISKPENRNVVEGMNHMNGNQALGYCRVRKVATKDNVNNDFGRTSRQREVISAIFEQVKNKSYFELIGIANTCLPFVTTDLSADQIEEYLNMLVTIGGMNVKTEELRIPEDKAYKYATYKEMSVLELNMEKNREALRNFIYGNNLPE